MVRTRTSSPCQSVVTEFSGFYNTFQRTHNPHYRQLFKFVFGRRNIVNLNGLFLFLAARGYIPKECVYLPASGNFYKVGKNMDLSAHITFKQFCVKSRMWNTYQYHVSRGSARFWAFVIPVMGEWIWCIFYYLRELRRLYDDPFCDEKDLAVVDKTFACACERFGKKVVF